MEKWMVLDLRDILKINRAILNVFFSQSNAHLFRTLTAATQPLVDLAL
jgi:hypothetical protein